MTTVLCFGDSNTHGANPKGTIEKMDFRHPWEVRYPGKLQKLLGSGFMVYEEGQGSRTTVFDDPTSPNKRGLDYLPVAVESHNPDIVVIMLGTNDTKPCFNADARMIGEGMARLIRSISNPAEYWWGAPPKIIIASPVPLHDNLRNSSAYGIFDDKSLRVSKELAGVFESVAKMYRCEFVDCGSVASTTPEECVHLPAEAHDAIARLLCERIVKITDR